jgi:hypothetical protein
MSVPPAVPLEAVLPPPAPVPAPGQPSTGRLEIVIEPAPRRPPPSPLPGPVDPLRARALELEAGLAKGPQIYLVLDTARRKLAIKARGLTLDEVPVAEIALLHHGSLVGGGAGAPPPVPVVWTVREGPGDAAREVIAPESLRPYVQEDEREEATAGEDGEDEPEAKPIPTPPTAYRVKLDSGWELAVLDRPPAPRFAARYTSAVRDGLLRLIGRLPERPPLLAVTVAADDARRLHHVFRTDLPVLIAAGAPLAAP